MTDTIINTRDCEYKKATGTLVMPFNSRFPREVFVESHISGRVVHFIHIQPGHPLFNEDGWDGEQAVYQPTADEAYTNAKILVLHHF